MILLGLDKNKLCMDWAEFRSLASSLTLLVFKAYQSFSHLLYVLFDTTPKMDKKKARWINLFLPSPLTVDENKKLNRSTAMSL